MSKETSRTEELKTRKLTIDPKENKSTTSKGSQEYNPDTTSYELSTAEENNNHRYLHYKITSEDVGNIRYFSDIKEILVSTDNKTVLNISPLWFEQFTSYNYREKDKEPDKIPEIIAEVTAEILIRPGLNFTILEFLGGTGSLFPIFKELRPSVVMELVNKHSDVSANIIWSAIPLLQSIPITLQNNLCLLNLYQHPAIHPFMEKNLIIGNNDEAPSVTIDQLISSNFFKYTLIFKTSHLLLNEIWENIASYLKLQDVDIGLPGWHQEIDIAASELNSITNEHYSNSSSFSSSVEYYNDEPITSSGEGSGYNSDDMSLMSKV